MTRMFGPTRLLLAAGLALLCLVLALGYASAQSPPAALHYSGTGHQRTAVHAPGGVIFVRHATLAFKWRGEGY